MDEDEVFERLTEIDMTARTDKAEAFEDLAKSLPVGEHGRASFLIAAGDHRPLIRWRTRSASPWTPATSRRSGPCRTGCARWSVPIP